ncbi:GNAT family N-acetyltransferase [Glaciibacter superstes]|uniref:GNAT family N-acetyltransferase n=1 Tax=Glaciibacter superstes TaxID=501023 RepID=UPI0003B76796|nr:GNAT family N-acetyltransferase [Glaciibacter superstes]
MAGNAEGMVTLTGTEQDGADMDLSVATTPDAEDLIIIEDSDVGIYEATLGGVTVAGVVYSKTGSRVTLLATSVFPEFRGRGIAARLLGGVLDKLRAQGETVTVTCPFAAEFVSAHPEYADVRDSAIPGNSTARRGH